MLNTARGARAGAFTGEEKAQSCEIAGLRDRFHPVRQNSVL
jgi:hypothetical protein